MEGKWGNHGISAPFSNFPCFAGLGLHRSWTPVSHKTASAGYNALFESATPDLKLKFAATSISSMLLRRYF